MMYVKTQNMGAIASHNGDWSFTNGPIIFDVDDVFNTSWKPEWINSDFGRRIITEIDHKDILNSEDPRGDLAYKFGLAPAQLCTGTKNCFLARFFVTKQRIYMSKMGPNCFKYLFEASDYRDIKVTVDYYVPVTPEDIQGHKVHFEDLGKTVTSAIGFAQCLSECEVRRLFGPYAEGGRRSLR